MILTGFEIEHLLRTGDIVIEPFSPAQINPNSYNFRLGQSLIALSSAPEVSHSLHSIGPAGYVLKPGTVYLGHTLERLASRRYVMTLSGRSSVGRLGLFVNITADLGHVGSDGQWTLELTTVQPLRVYSGLQIGQIAFWSTFGLLSNYEGRYLSDRGPVLNRDRALFFTDSERSGEFL